MGKNKRIKSYVALALLNLTAICYGSSVVQKINNSCKIYVGSSTVEKYAADELKHYLEKITNVHFEIIQNFKNKKKIDGFVLGTPETFQAKNESIKSFLANIRTNSDGFCIAPDKNGKTLFIVGRNPKGILYGVYDYLEKEAGIGFFDDGERIPEKPLNSNLLPPYKKLPEMIVASPKFDYRGHFIWARYYGPKRSHPASWTYEDWVQQLRALAQRRVSSVLIYIVGYTRLWGDTQRRAFPEIEFKDVYEDIPQWFGADAAAKSGYGRNPEEITKMMKKVYDFGRNQLGLKFEFNFYLGDFEEAVYRAYPTNKWIPTRTPSYGVGGRGHTLSQSDPLCKKLCQKFWKSFIDTFGTDHRYWVAYREESRHENNPKDPDYGFSQADAVKKAKEWITEIDPKAEIFHWDWHFLPTYVDADIYSKIKKAKKAEEYPHKEIKKSFKEYFKQIPEDITIMNVLTPGLYSLPPLMYPYNIVDITDHYDGKHPWVIGSLMGYAQQDIGYGGLFVSTKKMFSLWRRWVKEDPGMGNKLRGVFHYNELVQVNPLLSQMISEFAWSGILPDSLDSINTNEPMLDNYFSLRFGKKNAPLLRKCNAEIFGDDIISKAEKEENFRLAPQYIRPSIRIPIFVGYSLITDEQKRKRKKILDGLEKLVSVRESQQNNPLYANEVVDSARYSLHYLGRMWLIEAIDIAKKSKKYPDAKKRFDEKTESLMKKLKK